VSATLTYTTTRSNGEVRMHIAIYAWAEVDGFGPVEARLELGPKLEWIVVRLRDGSRRIVARDEIRCLRKLHEPPWPFRVVASNGDPRLVVPA
jgi:hypothetical protein